MRHESQTQRTETWLTPMPIVRALGRFDLDPCGLTHWATADRIYQLPIDGFREPWQGRVWLNPPYGNQQWPWMAKLAQHGTGTALIFARTETEGFRREVWAKASGLLFLHGRISFHYANGKQSKISAGAPSVLVAYGPADAERLAGCSLRGAFVSDWVRPDAVEDEPDLFGGAA